MYDRFYYDTDLNAAIKQAVVQSKTEFAWVLHNDVDYTNFNLRYLPSVHEQKQSHVWSSHNNPNSHTVWLLPVDELKTKLEIEKNYHSEILPASTISKNWITDDRIDYSNFDFNWLPNSWDADKNHAFAMQGTEQLCYTFLINNNTAETVYHRSDLRFKPGAAADEWHWITDNRIDYSNFDFTWLPDAWDVDKIHWFPMSGTEKLAYTKLINIKHYTSEEKYHSGDLKFIDASDEWQWEKDPRIDYSNFDFTWLPDAWDIDKIHCFTMFGTEKLTYTKLINTKHSKSEEKYHHSDLKFKPGAASDEWQWEKDPRINYSNFDFTWLPDAWDIDKIHCFTMYGTEKLAYTKLINNKHSTSEEKYHRSDLKFKLDAAIDEWHWITDDRIDYSNFNFTWLPDAWDIDKEHCFVMAGLEQLSYTKLINTKNEIKGTKYHTSNLKFIDASDEWVWVTDDRVDYSNFDFTWLPDAWDMDKKHCFCMYDTEQLYYTYLYNAKLPLGETKYYKAGLKFKEPMMQITKDEVSRTDLPEWVWVIDSRVDYSKFNFDWLPDAFDLDKAHYFCMNGYRELSYTQLLNTRLPTIENKYHRTRLKFKREIQDRLYWPNFVTTILSGFDWYDSLANWVIDQEIDEEWLWVIDPRIDYSKFDFTWLPDLWDLEYIHCFTMQDKQQLSYTWLVNTKTLKQKKFKFHQSDLKFNKHMFQLTMLDMGNTSKITQAYDKKIRFTGNMNDVLRSAIRRCDKEWLYVASSISGYTNHFNFSWFPDLDQLEFTHCWPSPKQIKGETFLIHIPTFLKKNEFTWNFDHKPIRRLPWPVIHYEEDSLAEAINNHHTSSLYTFYCKIDVSGYDMPEPCLWNNRPVVSACVGNSNSLVPRDCCVKKEIYEYEYLEKQYDPYLVPLDIIFIHNGENNSGDNLSRLDSLMPSNTEIKVSSGVNGRLKAYQAAAELSSTDWFLAVFAKCSMKDSFSNFRWRPDYWQQPKHYIFYNHNADLDLTYGHMAPIAYNKKLMLANKGGLDMTLAQEHAVVPMVISETRLTSPWEVWRTSFRETIKLLYYAKQDQANNIELQHRLCKWMESPDWYKKGADDAKSFFESVDGDLGWILVTNEWDWLMEHFNRIYAKQNF
jgi:hypothetical protein